MRLWERTRGDAQARALTLALPALLHPHPFTPPALPARITSVLLAQLVVGLAASIPFLRRRGARAAHFALTFWLAGAVTLAGQPISDGHGHVVGLLHGSLAWLAVYDLLVVAWGTAGALLYITFLAPFWGRARPRPFIHGVLLGNALVALLLLALLPAASARRQVLAEGVWFPVAPDMAPAPVVYDLVGKTYLLTMFAWGALGSWQAASRLPQPAARFGVRVGCCLACGVLAQSLAVTGAQWRHEPFFGTPRGDAVGTVWLLSGGALPLVALFAAGAVRRTRLLLVAQELDAMTQAVLATLTAQHPERRANLTAWGEQGVARDGEATWLPANARLSWLRRVWRRVSDPVGEVDRVTVLLRDLIRAHYPLPSDATALAGRWLWGRSPACLATISERDIALLLLAATLAGGEAGSFEPFPLDYPQPLTRQYPADQVWGQPAGAHLLLSVWHILRERRDRSVNPAVRGGVRETRETLQIRTPEQVQGLLLDWLETLEQTPPDDGPAQEEGWLSRWWLPLALARSVSSVSEDVNEQAQDTPNTK